MRKWLYKKGQEPKIFIDAEIENAQSNGWVDSPADVKKGSEQMELLTAEAQALGISIVASDTPARLKAKIANAKKAQDD